MSQFSAALSGTEKLGRFASAAEAQSRGLDAVLHPADPWARNGRPAQRKVVQRRLGATVQVSLALRWTVVGGASSDLSRYAAS